MFLALLNQFNQWTYLGINEGTKIKNQKRKPCHCDEVKSSTNASSISDRDTAALNLNTRVIDQIIYSRNSQVEHTPPPFHDISYK